MEFVNYSRRINLRTFSLTSLDLINAAFDTNQYITRLVRIFNEIGFDIFYSLGQRNISGFIGEIYKNMLAKNHSELVANPHPDGRPDILLIDTDAAKTHYANCFSTTNQRSVPIKELFSPFEFGGLEVKCSIGSSGKPQTTRFIEENGHAFSLYESRVGYLNGITWWAHHSSSSNLLGLYYDYYKYSDNAPQILAAFYSELDSDDWNAVSHGNPQNKKTSNTSLNKQGLLKMKNNCMFCISDRNYQDQMRGIGVRGIF